MLHVQSTWTRHLYHAIDTVLLTKQIFSTDTLCIACQSQLLLVHIMHASQLSQLRPCRSSKRWPQSQLTKASMPQKACSVVQGLIDAHVHLLGGGQSLSWVDLRHANSKAAVAEAVKAVVGQ